MKNKEKQINSAEETKKEGMFKAQFGTELTDEQLSTVAAGYQDIELILPTNSEKRSSDSNS